MKKYVFEFYNDILNAKDNKPKFTKTIEAENSERASKEAYETAIETNTFYSLKEELTDAR